jgi:Family of unknown function (DUF6069)
MSTVTTSPEITVEHVPSRLTSTLPRTAVSVGVLAAAVTTASKAALVGLHLVAAAIIVPVLARHAD